MRPGLLLLSVLLLRSSSAYADSFPILLITGGSLDVTAEGLGHFDIRGTRDFRLTEIVDAGNAVGRSCRPCAPGDLLDLGGSFAEDFGSATLDGVSYTVQNEAGAGSWFFAEGMAPAFGTSGVLSVPFTYDGFFSPPGRAFELLGQGMATIRLRQDIRDQVSVMGVRWSPVRLPVSANTRTCNALAPQQWLGRTGVAAACLSKGCLSGSARRRGRRESESHR